MSVKEESSYYSGVFTQELLDRLRPVGSALGDDIPIVELKNWKANKHPQWTALMADINQKRRWVAGTISTALGYLINGVSPQVTVGDLRRMSSEKLAKIDISSSGRSAFLGKPRAEFMQKMVGVETQTQAH